MLLAILSNLKLIPAGPEAQLKVLQALPSLLQNYPGEVRGDLLSTVLHICSGLQNAKNPAVSGTAAATLQQLVITVFDRVASEDGQYGFNCALTSSHCGYRTSTRDTNRDRGQRGRWHGTRETCCK